jgi:hypothetical protein
VSERSRRVPTPINGAEAEYHLGYVEKALQAETEAERRSALGGGLLFFGHRFLWTLGYLREQSDDDATLVALDEEAQTLFILWLNGEPLSDRADDRDRRADAAIMMLEEYTTPVVREKAARALLALPEADPRRDLSRIHDALVGALDGYREEADPDGELRVIAELVEHDLELGEHQLVAPAVGGCGLEPAVAFLPLVPGRVEGRGRHEADATEACNIRGRARTARPPRGSARRARTRDARARRRRGRAGI